MITRQDIQDFIDSNFTNRMSKETKIGLLSTFVSENENAEFIEKSMDNLEGFKGL